MAGDSFIAFLAEQLAPLGPVQPKRMFGGHGMFCHGVMFGLVVRQALYLRADAENLALYQAAGAEPFRYTRQGKMVALAYHLVPDGVLDEPEEMLAWARSALGAARRVAAARPARRRARPPG